jgi:poly(3-hydroxybutyrate) depolymerase
LAPTHELATNLHEFVGNLIHASANFNFFSIPVMPEEGTPGTDYGFVGLRMGRVVAWHLDGLVNAAAAAALWADMGGSTESPDDPEEQS